MTNPLINSIPTMEKNAIHKILKEENEFVINLWERLPIPYSSREQTGGDELYLLPDSVSKTGGEQRKFKMFKQGEGERKKTVRAKSLEELYAKRNTLKGSGKLNFKDKMLKKGLKHKITKQRRKQERKMRKKLPKLVKCTKEDLDSKAVTKMELKRVFNSEGKMVFSKFDFTGGFEAGTYVEKKKKDSVNSKLLLDKLQKHKDKLKHLESEGKADIAADLKEKEAWKKVMKKVEGHKVKDDVELLKKSVRRMKDKKLSSKKKWEVRLANAEKLRKSKQEKRVENLVKRKKEVKKKKMKKAAKKGRVIIPSS